MKHILRCQKCGKYTLRDECECGGKAVTTKPPRYSSLSKWAKYRRKARHSELEKKGLL
jgi:H/ACA ribonucleoprotein complex subunit 3